MRCNHIIIGYIIQKGKGDGKKGVQGKGEKKEKRKKSDYQEGGKMKGRRDRERKISEKLREPEGKKRDGDKGKRERALLILWPVCVTSTLLGRQMCR